MLRRFGLPGLLLAVLALSTRPGCARPGAPRGDDASDQAAIQEAARWIGRQANLSSEYRYVMTCRLRLLFFWSGKDDVGGGYVRIGKTDDAQQMIQVLFGSDPAKAPLSVNRWGAGTEVLRGEGPAQTSAFFGFMKSSQGQSALAMQREISRERSNGSHRFEGIISRVDQGRALSTTVPFDSNTDFDFHQYAEAEKAALAELEGNPQRRVRRLDGAAVSACPRADGFLSTILQLIDGAVKDRPTPVSLCYIYNARHYTATLTSVHPVDEKTVHVALRGNGPPLDRTYHHLKDARFQVEGKETGTRNSFEILIGTEGDLRGVPLQITYQPNFWFQIVLNLAQDSPPQK